MAYCYQKQNDMKNAKKWYEKAIKVNDTTALAAQAETRLAEVKEALKDDDAGATASPAAE